MWILCGAVSVVLTAFTCLFAFRKSQWVQLSAVSAVSLAAVTALLIYRMVYDWVEKWDASALMDVVPTMYRCLCVYIVVILAVNLSAAIIPIKNQIGENR